MNPKILGLFLVLLIKTQAADDFFAILQILNDMESSYDPITNRTYKLPDDVEIVSATLKFSSNKQDGNIYDFIIVGAGSAGSALASRLSENYGWKILLLEAGSLENTLSRIPLFAGLLTYTDYSWGYQMEYQPNFAKGFKNKRLVWPCGRALGGSSVINNLLYSRGNPLDFDGWEKQGNPGWGYGEVLKYFIKSEECSLHHADYDYHGTHGNLSVSDSYQPKFLKIFVQAGKELGYKGYVDYNTPHQLGFTSCQGTIKHGRRHTTARAFLFDKLHQLNLVVKVGAFVTKILIGPKTKVAYGVEYLQDGTIYRAFAKKEVVVSAGALNTPKILMLSGVGPEDHLSDLGIPVISDLPVGQNLHDHPLFMGLIFRSPKPVAYTNLDLFNPFVIKDFLLLGKGPYTALGSTDAFAYIHTNLNNTKRPDVELLVQSAEAVGVIGKFVFRYDDHYYKEYWGKIKGTTIGIYPAILHPKSCGSVRLRNADPHSEPLLYGNIFTDPDNIDMKTMIAAIRFTISLANTDSFKRHGITFEKNLRVPGCTEEFNSDEYWECAIRTFTITMYHYFGTCKMGPRDDPESVVNHELRVYGVQGLRVVDTSIIPTGIGAHTNAPAVMIGEKAADMIQEYWRNIPEP